MLFCSPALTSVQVRSYVLREQARALQAQESSRVLTQRTPESARIPGLGSRNVSASTQRGFLATIGLLPKLCQFDPALAFRMLSSVLATLSVRRTRPVCPAH